MKADAPVAAAGVRLPLLQPADDPRLDRVFTIDLRLLGLSPDTQGARLLDVGCGAGRHELAAARLPIRTIACDLGRRDLRDGRFFVGEDGKAGAHFGHVEWVQGTALTLPFAPGSIDAAICSETLEHVVDDMGALRELRRVVRTGGALAVSVPARAVELALWQLSWEVTHTPGGHIRIYHTDELLGKLRATGWRPYAVRRRHAFESVYWLLGALGGGGDPPCAPARAWRKATNSPRVRTSRAWYGAECALSRVLPKSVAIYARAV
ncbi:MAG: methyltransferase domain-containing protein [Dehalococcoidia bacterium]|nr:methyltransferase domain-containing protein [Dehalococcoidia bacterium]